MITNRGSIVSCLWARARHILRNSHFAISQNLQQFLRGIFFIGPRERMPGARSIGNSGSPDFSDFQQEKKKSAFRTVAIGECAPILSILPGNEEGPQNSLNFNFVCLCVSRLPSR
jgi:hypothetical protein